MQDFDKFIEELIKQQETKFKLAVENMVSAKEYVKKHNHFYYCEIIINKDGLIAEAHPSHTEFLRRYAGLTEKEVLDLDVDNKSTPLDILLKYTGCVAVWYEGFNYEGNLSKEQKEALCTLIENNIVGFKLKEAV